MNQEMKKYLCLMIVLISLIFAGGANLALAQYVPLPYGEVAPEGQILIDKKIHNPEAEKGALDEFVDNLGPQDYHFSPGEEIYFEIMVKNTGETSFEKARVTDTLPPYLELVSGSLEVEYQELKPDESRKFGIRVKVVSADRLPNDKGLYCVINKVEMVADDQTDEDTAQICIEKKVFGVKVQPEAGADLWLLGLGFLSIAFLGLITEKNFS